MEGGGGARLQSLGSWNAGRETLLLVCVEEGEVVLVLYGCGAGVGLRVMEEVRREC